MLGLFHWSAGDTTTASRMWRYIAARLEWESGDGRSHSEAWHASLQTELAKSFPGSAVEMLFLEAGCSRCCSPEQNRLLHQVHFYWFSPI